MIRPLTIFRSM